MFPRAEIQERLAKFVLVRLWTNDPRAEARSPEWKEMLLKRFGTSGIPLYAALSPQGETLGSTGFAGGTAASFVPILAAFLDAALGKAK